MNEPIARIRNYCLQRIAHLRDQRPSSSGEAYGYYKVLLELDGIMSSEESEEDRQRVWEAYAEAAGDPR